MLNKLKNLTLFISSVAMMGMCNIANAQTHNYQLKKYEDPQTLGILYGLTSNGQWGIIQNGSSAAGGTAYPQVFNTETGKAEDRGKMWFQSISDDANITVGSNQGRPASYNYTTDKVSQYSLASGASSGILNKISADGKWAVGVYNMGDEMLYQPVLVDVEHGRVLNTPNLPTKDMLHQNEGQNAFFDITPDGRYVVGAMSDCYIGPAQLFTYVYDTKEHTYDVIGFIPHDDKPWEPLFKNLYFVDGGNLTADGHYLVGEAYIVDENDEYALPYRYDLQTKEFKVFDSNELKGRIAYCADNQGTMLIAVGSKGAATPLRDFSVLYKDKYLVPFSTICQQYYGFNFFNTTGYENTGTPMGISGDGTKFVAFADPQGESYWFDFGATVEDVCSEIDLLGSYTVTPADGAEISKLQTVLITFDRSIEVKGDWSDVKLLDKSGNLVANAATSGFHVNSDNPHQVLVQFSQRNAPVLTPGDEYTIVINEKTICIPGDQSIANREIRLHYVGRENKPVEITNVFPAIGSDIAQFDNVSSFVSIDFDTKVTVSSSANATLQRTDGTIIAYFSTFFSNETGKGRVVLVPSGPCYLYAGQDYEVVINAGCITDLSGNEASANKEIRLAYKGIYQRPVPQNGVIFEDDFNNMAVSLNTWLRYEGDHLTPSAEMQNLEFDADNQPWNFSIRESEESTDICAASHSIYSPSGQSCDIMMTPLLEIPNDDKVSLEFDAQSYRNRKTDVLKILVLVSETQYSSINDALASDILHNSELIFEEKLNPGSSEENLSGDWTHYVVNIGEKFKNKTIYIAFLNDNKNQSMIFVDNVKVQRESFYELSFVNEETVVAANEIVISGSFKVLKEEAAGKVVLTLLNSNNETVDTVTLNDCALNSSSDFKFKSMPISIGRQNNYSINISAGEKSDTYKSMITNLSFSTTKHVVLEEMTGQGCPNCPLGILTIEKLKKMYNDLFIPISIHTYTGDRLGAGLSPYSDFLELSAAPSARINRLPGIYYPMYSVSNTYYDEFEGENLWRTVVGAEINRLAPADITLNVGYNAAESALTLNSDVTFALNFDNKQYNLMYVIMEDGIAGRQSNNLYTVPQQSVLGEWCESGIYAQSTVSPFTHDDVVRATVGESFSGTAGLLPSEITAGEVYNIAKSCSIPENIVDINKVHVAVLLIDPATGLVENACEAKVNTSDAITSIENDSEEAKVIYNLNGQRVNEDYKGFVIINGKKYLKK